MKKLILYFLTSITSLWLIDLLLSGFRFKGGPTTVFLVSLFVLASIYLVEQIISKSVKKSGTILFIVFGMLLTFFALYVATLVIGDFSVAEGSLQALELGIVDTPVIKSMDQILTMLLGSLITMLVAALTRWASSPGKSKDGSQ